jgi:hypothetical protein
MYNCAKKIIGCAAVIEEMLPILPPEISYETLDFGLHLRPENLKDAIQDAIDRSAEEVETLILGYGLCSNGAAGLKAPPTASIVIPKVHDCIAIFLGSHENYKKEMEKEAGTFFLAKGFIEVGDTPLDEYHKMIKRYGKDMAARVMKTMFAHYTRLLFLDTGHDKIGKCRDHSKHMAKQLGLRYEEKKGSRALIKKMIHGPWDHEFIIAKPGETITMNQFLKE